MSRALFVLLGAVVVTSVLAGVASCIQRVQVDVRAFDQECEFKGGEVLEIHTSRLCVRKGTVLGRL